MGGAWFKSRPGLIEVSRAFMQLFQTNARIESLLGHECSRFDPRPLRVEFVVDQLVPEIVFYRVLGFPLSTSFSSLPCSYFISPLQYVILATHSVFRSNMFLCCNCLPPAAFQFIIHQSPWHRHTYRLP